jgi:ATP-dependent RNA helicase DeaD
VHIKGEKRAAGKLPRVRQVAYIVSRAQKVPALGRILEFEDPASAIVFCRTRVEVDELTDTLKSHGFGAEALHGGMEQKQRDRVMQLFRQEKADILVATDVAARGLDIDHVSHVINFDIPTSPEVYVHRIGRTGRIGREGVAITLLDPREQRALRLIEGLTAQRLEIAALPTVDALRARRLEITRAALKERLVAGDLGHTRAVVESLAADFELVDIAAAAIAMMHDGADPAPDAAPAASASSAGAPPDAEGPMAVLFVGAGSASGIRPGDLVGAITGEARVTARDIGAIRVSRNHSLVQVQAALADKIVKALRKTKIKGQQVSIRLDRQDQEDRQPRRRT